MTEKQPLPESNPVQDFFREITIIEHLARTRMESALPDGMKAPHFGVLSHLISANKKETPAEIASIFQVTRPTMTNTLQRLSAKHYITIEPDPNDGRGKLVSITDEGKSIFFKALTCLEPNFRDIVESLGIDVFANALPHIKTIRRYMDDNR